MLKLPTLRNTRSGFFEDGDFAALLLELPEARGVAYCWCANYLGQLGDGTTT